MLVKTAIQKILAEALVKKNFLSQSEVDRYSTEAKLAKETLRAYLARYDILNDQQIIEALAEYLHLETVDLKHLTVDKSVIERIPV